MTRSALASCLVDCKLTITSLPALWYFLCCSGRLPAGTICRVEPRTTFKWARAERESERSRSSSGSSSSQSRTKSARRPRQWPRRLPFFLGRGQPVVETFCPTVSEALALTTILRQAVQRSANMFPCSSASLRLGIPERMCRPSMFCVTRKSRKPAASSAVSARWVLVGRASSQDRLIDGFMPFFSRVHTPRGPLQRAKRNSMNSGLKH